MQTYCQLTKRFVNKNKIIRYYGCNMKLSQENVIQGLCPDCYIEHFKNEENKKCQN